PALPALTPVPLATLAPPAPDHTRSTPADVVPHPFPAVFCRDWSVPIRDHREFAALTARAARAAPTTGGSPLNTQVLAACVGRADDVVVPQRDLDLSNSPKVLLLNARHDPSTAHAWAANVHRRNRASTALLTCEGWGHGVYDRTACTRSTTDAHLLHLTAPARPASCPAVDPPALSRTVTTAPARR
ncbi:alpha/beta hydrolase, partial [Actinosynnema sp.]|uniref:alpha/beta hydrolase n=1 Tax=Actinosynnema sp. TaxID=1872144 RepID=UPI003F85EA5E